jgi:Bacterial archaeo-eukaryotic release factor family 7
MDLFTRRNLQELAGAEQETAVSIYIPTERAGREIRQNDLRWKNALKAAEEQLSSAGLNGGDVKKLLDEPRRLAGDTSWWENQDDGLAAFLVPGRFERYRLPLRFDEAVVVAPRFHVKPLLPVLEGDGRFYILAVSQNHVRLLESTRYTVSELDPQGLPKNLREALNIDEYVASLQHHTGEKGRLPGKWGIFHGHGGANMDVEKQDEIRQYFRVINRALGDFFEEERTPLVFAGVEYLFPIFKEVCDYNRLVDRPVTGNPDELSAADLQKKAWSVVEPLFAADVSAELDRYGKASSENLSSDDLRTVLQAARERRVDTLFMARGAELWGTIDETPTGLEVAELPGNSADAEDLVNYAVEKTLLGDGKIYSVDRDRMPGTRGLAAIFRYPA